MKILQVIDSLATGGAEKLLLDMLPLVNDRGATASVDVALLDARKTPFLEILEKQNVCRIYRLSTSSVYNPLLIFRLIPLLRSYDIVHVHLFPAQYWVVLAKIIGFSKVKLVFTEHSTSNKRMSNPIYKPLEKIIYHFYNPIICITSAVKVNLEKFLSIAEDKLIVLNNGVDVEKINISNPYNKSDFNIKDDSIVITMVAGFRPEKDHDTVLRALRLLPSEYIVLFVGDGITKKNIIDRAVHLNVDDRVRFLGIRTDVYSIIKMSEIVVLSSHVEGFGLAAVEGMAAGKPVIGTNVEGLSNVLNDAGLIFEANDERALADAVFSLQDKSLRDSVIANGIRRSKLYSLDNYVNNLMKLYIERKTL